MPHQLPSTNPNKYKMVVKVFNVIVKYKDEEFYATLEISLTRILIIPYDEGRVIFGFTESYLDGFIPYYEPNQPEIHLNMKNAGSVCILKITEAKDFAHAETALTKLMGADTDYDPNEIEEEDADAAEAEH